LKFAYFEILRKLRFLVWTWGKGRSLLSQKLSWDERGISYLGVAGRCDVGNQMGELRHPAILLSNTGAPAPSSCPAGLGVPFFSS